MTKQDIITKYVEEFEKYSTVYYEGIECVFKDEMKLLLTSALSEVYDRAIEEAEKIVSHTEIVNSDVEIAPEVVDFYKHAVEETKKVISPSLTRLKGNKK